MKYILIKPGTAQIYIYQLLI